MATSTTGPTRTDPAVEAFRGLRWRLLRNQVRLLLTGSRLRLLMIALCSVLFWLGLFALFFEGFQFLAGFTKLTNEIVEYVFGLFFFSLLVMLIFSTGMILHNGLFGSREAAFLLTTPAPGDRVFAYKFAEAIAFSSWGFLLLGSPLMVAYGITAGTSATFYLVSLAYLLAFVMIPGGLGALAVILIAHFLPRRRRTVLVVALAGLAVAATALGINVARGPDVLTNSWLDVTLSKFRFSQNELLPSHWIAKGLIADAQGRREESLYYLFVTASHGAVAYLAAAVVARDLYRPAYSRVQGGRSSRRRRGLYGFDRFMHRAMFFLPEPIRLLILKDLRVFRRDPAQWSQFLIFFGLLAIYFLNIRNLGYHAHSAYWRNLQGLMNLAVTALLLSTFTSRFIFPMLSLEGRNFWVLGLLPLRREAILWGKFAFASGISLVATEGLVVLSDVMLGIPGVMLATHTALVAILCLGLSGISVGLGATMPNLKEDDPSKIATGFGGTLNLLVSLVFITAIIAGLAVVCHVYLADRDTSGRALSMAAELNLRLWLVVVGLASLIVGVVATVVPLRIGIRAFNAMEF